MIILLMLGQSKGVLGPNGAGKSSLLNIIYGTDEDFDGEVTPSCPRIHKTHSKLHHMYRSSSGVDPRRDRHRLSAPKPVFGGWSDGGGNGGSGLAR